MLKNAVLEAHDGWQHLNLKLVHEKLGLLHIHLGKLHVQILDGQLEQMAVHDVTASEVGVKEMHNALLRVSS